MVNLEKAKGFHRERNFVQSLRYGELARTKLKQLKDRRLETVQVINDALACKYDALNDMGRYREAMECAEECYTLWAMNQMRNPGSMTAAFALIQSCIHNGEYEDAEHYARHAYFMIAEMTDNFIPVDQRPRFLAEASYWLARAIYALEQEGGFPPEAKQKAGEEAIEHIRKALEIHTQLHGIESNDAAHDMTTLADIIDFFNNVDDDEILRLREQSIAIFSRLQGSSSYNAAVGVFNLATAYDKRANRAQAANDLDRCMVNLEMALPHYCEAARICRIINHIDKAEEATQGAALIEESMREIGIARVAATTTATATRG